MSTFLEKVRNELVASSAVADLLGAVNPRIYPLTAPQGCETPFAVITVVSDVPQNTFTGEVSERLRDARVQVDCYASRYLDAHAVATAVDGVVAALRRPDLCATREGARDLYDDEATLFRVSLDFSVWAGE